MDKPQAAIIDENFAKRFWPNNDAVGKHIWFDPKKPILIVGVVGNVKQYGLDNDSKIAVYFPHPQNPSNGMYLAVRASSSDAGPVVREIHKVDSNVPVYEIETMAQRLYDSLARRRFAGTMLAAFAGFAMLLAAIGLFGVMSYLVEQSKQDIGLRMALGAQPADILRLVLGQGMRLTAGGVLVGLIGALALTRVMSSLLFGVGATDLLTFTIVAVTLGVVGLVAVYIPARRATQVDPIIALRDE